MWVIAHRGGGDLYPENTLKAFQASEALGVDLVECDVHVSLDGVLMAIHDPTLERTGGETAKVSDLTADQLARIDVGSGEGVPTLATVLDLLSIPVVVELKTRAAVDGLLRLLASDPTLVRRVVPISFYHPVVKSLVDRVPGLEAGVLLVGVPVDLAQVAHNAHVSLVSLHHEMVDRELVDRMHKENLKVSVWTPNTASAIRAMVEAGVDGIASDRPDLVLQAVGRS